MLENLTGEGEGGGGGWLTAIEIQMGWDSEPKTTSSIASYIHQCLHRFEKLLCVFKFYDSFKLQPSNHI